MEKWLIGIALTVGVFIIIMEILYAPDQGEDSDSYLFEDDYDPMP